jgi:hypothetical protein
MHDPRSTAPDDSGAARGPPAGDAAHPPWTCGRCASVVSYADVICRRCWATNNDHEDDAA